MENIRPRASVLVTNKDKFVLIFRHKNGQDYYAIPGGGIEVGESPEIAAIREIDEELGLRLKSTKFISETNTSERHDFNFISDTDDTNLIVTGPEKDHMDDPNNLFKPEWHTKDTFRRDLPVFPETSRDMFNNFINQK
ncbi:MAG: NUDIX domain-containing protein [Candidatus Shapirobacteria bacterium]|jgi:8-oxo-dGTP pyrophosphatase MutT (NUDIX family)